MNLHLLDISLWFLPYAQVTGLGILLLKLLRFELRHPHEWLLAFWAGFAGLIACLQVTHFFLPVDRSVVLPLLALSVLGFAAGGRDLLKLLAKLGAKDVLFMAAAAGAVHIWIISQKAVVPVRYDTGLYHVQELDWLMRYPTVTGLGNFFTNLAFPQAYFFFAAFLEQAYAWMGGFYIASYVLAAAVLFEGVRGVRAIVIKADLRAQNFFRAFLFLPFIFYACYDSRIVTASPDAAVFLLELAMTALLFQVLEGPQEHTPAFFVFVITSFVGTVLKPSYAVFGVAGLALAAAWNKGRLPWLWFFFAGTAILAPFFIRNILLSGYLYFPSSFASLPVDWKVPAFIQDGNLACTLGYAKAGDCQARALGDMGWLGFWLKDGIRGRSGFFSVPLGLILFGCLCGGKRVFSLPVLRGLLPALLTSAAIFFTAPDCRFFGSSVWVLGLVAAAAAVAGAGALWRSRPVKGLVILLAGAFVLMSARGAWSAVALKHFIPLDRGHYKVLRLSATVSVLQLQGDDRCWATSLPCTPHRIGGLKLRDPGRIAAGFTRRDDKEDMTP